METPVGIDFSLALHFIKDGAIFLFSEPDTFLENRENVTVSSVRYNKCLLTAQTEAQGQLWQLIFVFPVHVQGVSKHQIIYKGICRILGIQTNLNKNQIFQQHI
ncbi:hypothetical protein AVEN_117211-1 [Araneus ventricosus]|uniref:Uncharacterized protein n=1 Tax=Araneus ventricosus TaxID=182803 RepID=A0A4Y2AZF8_ARAVE|nr:hypothetical protein AVEN_117211-1 [Araneus ventricosus]